MTRIIIVALVLILVTAGGGYWFWTTTPQYSLAQIKDSAAEHNLSKFQMYFNIDQVADSMVKDLLASPIRKVLGGELLERFLTSGMVSESTVQHEVGSSIAGDIKILVETGSFPAPTGGESSKVSMGSLDERLGISSLSLKKMGDIKVDGDTATVTMTLHNEKFNTDIDMLGELQKKDGYWQATRIINIVDCFQKLFDLEAKTIKSSRIPNPSTIRITRLTSPAHSFETVG
ncbi:MAG: hypothetical protein SGJ27_27405 [Candidatus Melainabacteria bacterium]|nr:hypothetical protein [Candidatus Melainabacteria bacterium]